MVTFLKGEGQEGEKLKGNLQTKILLLSKPFPFSTIFNLSLFPKHLA